MTKHLKTIFKHIKMEETVMVYRFGSQNYDSATPESDYDYRVFVVPTLEDWVNGTVREKPSIQDGDLDINFMDIRKLPKLLNVGHISNLELFLYEGFWLNPNWSELQTMLDKYDLTKITTQVNRGFKKFLSDKRQSILVGKPVAKVDPKTGFDPKQLKQINRIIKVIAHMNSGMSYLDAIKLSPEEVREINESVIGVSREDALKHAENIITNYRDHRVIGKGTADIHPQIMLDVINKCILATAKEIQYKKTPNDFLVAGRTVVFAHSYGSTNYGNTTPDSDLDMRYYVLPTEDDLYEGKMISKYVGDNEIIDIRLLNKLLYKSNPNYLELFNAKITKVNTPFQALWDWLQVNRYKLSTANRFAFDSAMYGMCMQKYNLIKFDKPTDDSNQGYALRMKYGFDTKSAAHFIRLIKIFGYVDRGEVEYLDLIDLTATEIGRSILEEILDVRDNVKGYTKETMLAYFDELIAEHFHKSVGHVPNTELFEELAKEIRKTI